jgi:16S rRNA (guanine(966)-N(2))-methyltransferase RsmD
MRIISGKYKGRRIFPPKNLPVRPTTDMSKEALFNVLNNHFSFEGLKILDLFSGTGNISFEFASRGSSPITSVDGDFGCVKFIKQIAAEFDFNIAATKSDVFAFLEKNKTTYDIIFADPPYAMPDIQGLHGLLYPLLLPGGWLIIEHKPQLVFAEQEFLKKEYGSTTMTIFAKP